MFLNVKSDKNNRRVFHKTHLHHFTATTRIICSIPHFPYPDNDEKTKKAFCMLARFCTKKQMYAKLKDRFSIESATNHNV